ncbi:hypothetical protein PTTG_00219 [Puccinia triticina 1-1 BBBD Race 1]|uniref:Uncharacterized protein n=1 Tax=Puccinia triticina (isolate 1-1 / race 1 (BBBD)) TaxID=630390 RepID=A0A180H316_PUCT1|nr:hypothetical protein PTTG_00219 [Puccinia triticina 1-1 BBBD Race 1]
METLANPFLLLDKLRLIANHEQVTKLKAITSAPSGNPGDNPHSGTALATTASRKRPYVACKNGKHNPDAYHEEHQCWTLHPKLRPAKKQRATNLATTTGGPSGHDGTTQSYAYQTSSQQVKKNAVILDSGASQHMFNSLKYFTDTTETNVFIVTGLGKETS